MLGGVRETNEIGSIQATEGNRCLSPALDRVAVPAVMHQHEDQQACQQQNHEKENDQQFARGLGTVMAMPVLH